MSFYSEVKSCSCVGDVIAVSDDTTDVYIYENRQNPYIGYLSSFLSDNRYVNSIEIDDESGFAVLNICEKVASDDIGEWYYYFLSEEFPNLKKVETGWNFRCFLSGGRAMFYSKDTGNIILDMSSGQAEIRDDLNDKNLKILDKSMILYDPEILSDSESGNREVKIVDTGITFVIPEGVVHDMIYNSEIGRFAALIMNEGHCYLQINDLFTNTVKTITIEGFQSIDPIGRSGSVLLDRLFWIGKEKIGVADNNSIYCFDINESKCLTVIKSAVDLLGYKYLSDPDMFVAIDINMELCFFDNFEKKLRKETNLELTRSGSFVEFPGLFWFEWEYIESHDSILLIGIPHGSLYKHKAWVISNKTRDILFEIADFDQYSKLEDRFYISPYILKFPFGYRSSDIYTIPFYGADDLIKCADEIKSMSKE